jgi:hypothetical protein
MKHTLHPSQSYARFSEFALDGPEKCSGLTVQRYSAETLDQAMNKDGRWMEMVESGREEHTTPGGSVQKFQWVLFKDVRSKESKV